MSSINSYAKNTAAILAINGFNIIIGLGTSILLARVLGPEGRGILALAVLLPTLIMTFTNLGIQPATVYNVSLKQDNESTIIGTIIIISLFIGLLSIGIGIVVAILFRGSVFHGVPYIALLSALIIITPTLIIQNLQGALLGVQKFNHYNISNLVQAILLLLLTALFLLVLHAGTYGALWANVIAVLLSCAIVMMMVRNIIGKPIWILNKSYLMKTFRYGIQAYLSNVIDYFCSRVDVFLVNLFLNPAAVGLYAVGVSIVEQIWIVSFAASTVLFPMISSSGNNKEIKSITPLISRTMLILNIMITAVLFIICKKLILILYGQAYIATVAVIKALFIGVIALGMGRILANDIAGRGKPMLNTYINIVSVIVNVTLNIFWIPAFGIVGAAWASTVSYMVATLGFIFVYTSISGVSWQEVLLIQRADINLYLQMASQVIRLGRNYLHESI
jgi:O-antigen/teichoic acid export membrane protein